MPEILDSSIWVMDLKTLVFLEYTVIIDGKAVACQVIDPHPTLVRNYS